MASAGVHVALLRGINVGGNNKLPMKDLVAIFERAGCTDVRHYIQSGNVVYRAKDALAATLGETIAAAIERGHKLKVPVVTRTADEVRGVVRDNPYLAENVDADILHVAFLAHTPAARAVAALDPARSPPEVFTVRGREIFMVRPNGVAKSKITNAWLDASLGTVSTVRNWRTVQTLATMCNEIA